MKKILWLLLLWPLAACGQVTPTSWQVSLTWTTPTPAGAWLGCIVGQPSCAYILSRATVAAGTTSCPATTGSAYAPLNQGSPATGTVYSDPTATGLTVCYIAQTIQGGAISQPSNTAGPFVVPGNPLPPVLNGSMSASLNAPELVPDAKIQLAKVTLRGMVTRDEP